MFAFEAQAQQQGVTKDQIVLGSIQDLSGPLAGFSKPAKNGMQMRVDEINANKIGVSGMTLLDTASLKKLTNPSTMTVQDNSCD